MKTLLVLLLAALSVALLKLDASALGRRPSQQWIFFHFNGEAFVPGKAAHGSSVAVREGVRPVVAVQAGKVEAVKLPSGTGAVAGICYVQSSGGKLRSGPGFAPAVQLPVQILSGERVVAAAECDADGYFVAIVPSGSYRVSAGTIKEVTVENGNTTLVPLRVGKRMVD